MEPTRKIEKVGMRNLRMEDYDQLAKSFKRIYADSDVFWTKEHLVDTDATAPVKSDFLTAP